MRIVLFCHSIRSDWNHGNAHFLRGVVTELLARGHDVRVMEPEDGWSARSLREQHGLEMLNAYRAAYPSLASFLYRMSDLDLDEVLDGADLVLVHEWNDHELVRRIGEHRASCADYRLLFHDTHHRAITDPQAMCSYDLSEYDGVLAFGEVIRDLYLARGWAARAWTWHEAADTRVFRPMPEPEDTSEKDIVWIGNWGDEERTSELHEFLLEPARRRRLSGTVHGVRYPDEAVRAVTGAGLNYEGWIANFATPAVYARHRIALHVPRRPYASALPGIPTIRVFEALACGMPLVCAPWDDAEGLFKPGRDYLVARDGAEMESLLAELLAEPDAAAELARHGRRSLLARHTCAHRVDELLEIAGELIPAATTIERSAVA